MKKVIYNKEENRIPIKSWVSDIEESAMVQVNNLSKLPFLYKHIALMPDCHMGYGMPIGGVIASKGYVIPNAVGVDIGCGIIAQPTNLLVKDFSTETLKQIMGLIRKNIPVGFNHNKEPCDISEMPRGKRLYRLDADNSNLPICSREFNSAMYQLGTLGGGNHFIEIQKGDDGYVWIMIHSGSRNLGKKVCDYYNGLAKDLNNKWFSKTQNDLNFLPITSEEGKQYMEEMNYCLDFAQENRNKMMNGCKRIFKEICAGIEFKEAINIHHNYAAFENHFKEKVIVHRKGATKATEGLKGIIPGSQGTCSYIVEGLGNPESFKSCSHGAGRKMGRKDACRRLNLEEEKKKLDDKGIVHGIRNVNDLDEASGAYKPIDEVMANQSDLVKILVKLEPLGVIKG